MRRQVAAEKKRATKLETNLKKVTNMYEARLVDMKAFKSALANRDEQLKVCLVCCSVAVPVQQHASVRLHQTGRACELGGHGHCAP